MEHENLEDLHLEKYSREYYYANQKVLEYQQKLQSALPSELQQTLIQLDDEYVTFYHLGFYHKKRLTALQPNIAVNLLIL